VLAAILLGAIGYLIWEATPGARYRRAFARADQAIAECDFAEARQQLAECIRLRPNDQAARLVAARTARRDGDLEAAEAHLFHYHNLTGLMTEAGQLESSMLAVQRGELQKEQSYLSEFLDIRHPSSELILESLAMGSLQLYMLNRATFWIHELLEKNPKSPLGRLLRAQVGQALGLGKQALESLRELVAEYPKYTKARLTLANVLVASHLYAEALGHYEQVSRESPQDIAARLGISRCLNQLARLDELRSLLLQLGEQYPDNSGVLLECGRFAIQEGRDTDAERYLRRASELSPNDFQVHRELGTCLAHLGKAEESAQHIEKSQQIEADRLLMSKAVETAMKNPADPQPRLEIGKICLRNGQDEEGLRWLYGLLERHPNHKPTHQLLADYYAGRNDLQKAEYHRRMAR
jgi:predicted Zn-dependent protease